MEGITPAYTVQVQTLRDVRVGFGCPNTEVDAINPCHGSIAKSLKDITLHFLASDIIGDESLPVLLGVHGRKRPPATFVGWGLHRPSLSSLAGFGRFSENETRISGIEMEPKCLGNGRI